MASEKFPQEVNAKENKNNWKTNAEKQLLHDEEREKPKTERTRTAFCHRNSLLTDLMKANHLQVIQNISIALFVLLVIGVVLFDMATPTEFWAAIGFLINDLSKTSVLFTGWISLNGSCVIVYYVFKWWTLQRIQHKKKNKILDGILLLLYVIYLITTFAVPAFCVVKFQEPKCTSLLLLLEQVRLAMKIYSFVRENVPRVLKVTSGKDEKKEIKSLCPNFQHFIYYLFAPTLIYRGSYPRTPAIRWKFVIKNLLHFIACLFVFYCTYVFYLKAFRNVGRVKFTHSSIAFTIAGSIAVGSLMLLTVFYGFLHCWQNIFAEILRFGDRLFYQDWWNSTSLKELHRKWNLVVGNWLHTYVYTDLQKIGCSKIIAAAIVFFISSFIHELILSFTLGFCICLFFVLFFLSGVCEEFVIKGDKTKIWNIITLMLAFLPLSFCFFIYSVENAARVNFPTTLDEPLDYFVPRFWTCNVLNQE